MLIVISTDMKLISFFDEQNTDIYILGQGRLNNLFSLNKSEEH